MDENISRLVDLDAEVERFHDDLNENLNQNENNNRIRRSTRLRRMNANNNSNTSNITIDSNNSNTIQFNDDNDKFEEDLQKALKLSKKDYNKSKKIKKDKVFNLPVQPMSMIPDKFYSEYYQKINQSSDKIVLPDSILSSIYKNTHFNEGKNELVLLSIKCSSNDDLGISKDVIDTDNIIDIDALNNQINIDNQIEILGSIGGFIPLDICYLPDMMFYRLNCNINQLCNFTIYESEIPKGKKIILKPENKRFLDIKDQQELLLNSFNNSFRILYPNQQIIIYSKELNEEVSFIIEKTINELDVENEIIKIYDVNLEVDFNIPPEFLPVPTQELQDIQDTQNNGNINSKFTKLKFNRTTTTQDNAIEHISNEKTKDKDKEECEQSFVSFSGNYNILDDTHENKKKQITKEEIRLKRLKMLNK